jgi:hypothetical protein
MRLAWKKKKRGIERRENDTRRGQEKWMRGRETGREMRNVRVRTERPRVENELLKIEATRWESRRERRQLGEALRGDVQSLKFGEIGGVEGIKGWDALWRVKGEELEREVVTEQEKTEKANVPSASEICPSESPARPSCPHKSG